MQGSSTVLLLGWGIRRFAFARSGFDARLTCCGRCSAAASGYQEKRDEDADLHSLSVDELAAFVKGTSRLLSA